MLALSAEALALDHVGQIAAVSQLHVGVAQFQVDVGVGRELLVVEHQRAAETAGVQLAVVEESRSTSVLFSSHHLAKLRSLVT